MSNDRARAGFPRNFFCEHSASKSRVLALVAAGAPESLRAVLTCTDRLLAERAASLLSQAVNGAPAVPDRSAGPAEHSSAALAQETRPAK